MQVVYHLCPFHIWHNFLVAHHISNSQVKTGGLLNIVNQKGLFFGSCKFQKSVHVKIRSVNNALQPRCIWGLSCHVACHIKSTNGGYLELKRFLSWSTYCWEKGYITIVSNFWTHCSKLMLIYVWIALPNFFPALCNVPAEPALGLHIWGMLRR